MITTEQVKALRDATGISVMQCKKALEAAGGDAAKALIILRKAGAEIAGKKSGRTLGAGAVSAYIHGNGNVGAMVELSCETDFVAKNEQFKALAYDIAMHVAASNPVYLKAADISEDDKAKAREVFEKDIKGLPAPAGGQAGKPAALVEKIMQGKLQAYFGEKTLLDQPFIKNPDLTVNDLIQSGIQKFGEKIEVARFERFSILGK
ncbi:MAG: elongation factor Ts [Candidatus Taylorbacteria bacterium]|nr:elongation factor Ts [Candidatus Taylorbacteria bacterium]